MWYFRMDCGESWWWILAIGGRLWSVVIHFIKWWIVVGGDDSL